MAVNDESGFDWLGALGRGLSVGTGLYDIYGTGRNTSTGINQAAAAAANPFGSQFQQYQAPLAQTTLTPKTNEFGAARSNLFGGYNNALTNPLSNQFGAGRSSLYGQYQDLLADPSKFTGDPFYQWQQEQGLGNLERSLAGRGLLDSGNALTEITKFGQGLAGQSYGNRLAQLQGGISTASGLYGQDVSQLGAGAGLASDIYGQDWNNLYRLSGAQQGSPSQAGQILAGRYGQLRNALGDIGYGLRGGSSSGSNPLNQLINQGISKGVQGVSDWFSGLGGGATGGSTALVDALLSGQVTAEQLPWITAGLEGGGDLGMLTTAQALQNPSWGGLDFLGAGGGEAAGSFGTGSEAAAAGLGGAAGTGTGTLAGLTSGYETVGGGFGGASALGGGGEAAAGFGGGAAGEGAGMLANLGGFAAAAALPALGYGLTAHQWAKDDARRAEAEQQYLPALRNWMSSHPEALDEYKRLLTLYGGGGDWGLGRSVAGKQMTTKYPELTRIVSENWLPGFLYQEYSPQLGDLAQYRQGNDLGYLASGTGDA